MAEREPPVTVNRKTVVVITVLVLIQDFWQQYLYSPRSLWGWLVGAEFFDSIIGDRDFGSRVGLQRDAPCSTC